MGSAASTTVLVILGLVSLAGEQGDVDFLHHLNPVQHFTEGVPAEGLRRVPDGGVRHAGSFRLQVEHVVAGLYAFRAEKKGGKESNN